MRGNKRSAAALVTAANKPQPALNDAVLDLANRKGMRCCVECGATSTPQWREGPMGPKTLCNACGVRRQRLLRKQQAAAVASVPTAPVAAVQARRRMTSRSALPAPTMESDELPYGVTSGSEHSSDETEVDWAAATPAKQQLQQGQRQQQQLQPHHEVEESCNEDESAAYDLLYFAGVERRAGGLSGAGSGCHPDHQRHSQLQQHGHNTRRHVHPVHRSDDYYYYEEEEAPGLVSGETDDDGGYKRRKVATAPPHLLSRPRPQVGPWVAGSSFSSSEDVSGNELASQQMKAADVSGSQQQLQQRQRSMEPPGCGNAPIRPQTVPATLGSSLVPAASVPAATTTTTMPSASASNVASFTPLFALPVPVALPVLPLSLPSLPAMSADDYQVLLKLQLDFQRACLQLHHANVQCEAVSAVVAERREAAASAHEQAAAASQQLAAEARAVADRYRLRDVQAEPHPAAATAALVADNKQEQQQERQQ